MSGGFGRGKIIKRQIDDSYLSGSNSTQFNDEDEGNQNNKSDMRGAFAKQQSYFSKGDNFDENYHNDQRRGMNRFTDIGSDSRAWSGNGFRDFGARSNERSGQSFISSVRGNEEFSSGRGIDEGYRGSSSFKGGSVGRRDSCRILSRGGRNSAFCDDQRDDDGHSFSHITENELSSRFPAEHPGDFSSGNGRNKQNGSLTDSDEKKGFLSGRRRGGGFGTGGSFYSANNNFGRSDSGDGFADGRINSDRKGFDGAYFEYNRGNFGSCNRGGSNGNGFSSGRSTYFLTCRSDFSSDANENVGKFNIRQSGFSNGRDNPITRPFNKNCIGRYGGIGRRSNTEEHFSCSRGGFSSSLNREGISRTVEPRRFVPHIPEIRPVEELYSEDAANAKYEVVVIDLDQEVTVTGVPKSQNMLKLESWKSAGFGDLLLRNIIKKSFYSIPRQIQAAVIPLVQNGWDIVGHAETGSGKTAAFVLPIINHIMLNGEPADSRCAPVALVLAPTRELVGQLYDQTRKFADGILPAGLTRGPLNLLCDVGLNGTGVTVAKAYGQYRMADNLVELERGCNVLFATMGRLKDFVDHGMMKNRQTLLFSATFTREVQELAATILKDNHAFVSNGKAAAANPLVEQNFVEVTSENKFDTLIQLLEDDKANNGEVSRTLVFVQRKQMADVMALNLVQKKIPSSSISGDRLQKQREEALSNFRKGNIRVLVATDVCSRGIDIKDLEHVINYDMPSDRVTYVHRIGRTGRLHRGKATSFINRDEQDPALIADVIQVVQDVQQVPPDFLIDIANRRTIAVSSNKGFAGASAEVGSNRKFDFAGKIRKNLAS
uniref:RNA helicase n=1 Tax=Setaria digitata TaxID=48799 RepID=A0A915PZ26_9BILA